MKRVIAAALSLLIVFSATILVFAKGTTTKIVITGAGLQRPIEISDSEILENFNVWSGPGTFANGVEGNEGFIADAPYRLNTKAIYRGREGNWFRPTAAWQSAFRNVVHG